MSSSKIDYKVLDYFDRTFFEVIDQTDFMVYLYAGKFNQDLYLDVYEIVQDFVTSDLLNSRLKKMAKKLLDSGMIFDLTSERIDILIQEYEQS